MLPPRPRRVALGKSTTEPAPPPGPPRRRPPRACIVAPRESLPRAHHHRRRLPAARRSLRAAGAHGRLGARGGAVGAAVLAPSGFGARGRDDLGQPRDLDLDPALQAVAARAARVLGRALRPRARAFAGGG